jgi:hypothetical protein
MPPATRERIGAMAVPSSKEIARNVAGGMVPATGSFTHAQLDLLH